MRNSTIFASTVLAIGMLTSGAMAATATSTPDVVGSTWGTTTCGEFMQMDTTAQSDFIAKIGQTSANGSLTSTSNNGGSTGNNNTSNGMTANNTTASNANGSTVNDSSSVPSTLNSTSLVADCQAASPSSTLQDAYSHNKTSGANDGSGK